jgi:hypothetical protein
MPFVSRHRRIKDHSKKREMNWTQGTGVISFRAPLVGGMSVHFEGVRAHI